MNNIIYKNCKFRTIITFSIFLILYTVALIDLYIIQIINVNYYQDLARKQHDITLTISPIRAEILDKNGIPVAINKESLSAFILPHRLEEPKKLKKFLKKYFPNSVEKLKEYEKKYFMFIKRRLNENELNLIKINNIIDIKILKESSRFYPIESMGQITGITDIDNTGLFGIEKQFNDQLGGSPTTISLEKDARSGYFYFKKETVIEGKKSNPIKLTIDSNLQFLVHEEIKEIVKKFNAKEVGAIIMNPQNGNIEAMVSFPSFNPNNFVESDIESTKNKVISDAYEFGSVMKVFVALASLEEGLVTPDELIDCENKKEVEIDGMKFTTWEAHGIIPFAEVIEKSNNLGIAKVAKRLEKKLYDHYKKIGFGKKTKLELQGEQKGFITPPEKWSKRSIISLSFGYEITATLLQLAKAFCIIANDGYDVKPQIIFKEKEDAKFEKKQIYSKQSIDTIKKILKDTVEKGTAKKTNIEGFSIMGKTGTANLAIDGQYSTKKNIYTFGCIIEKENYKKVIAVFVKEVSVNNAYSSTIAVPLCKKIAEKLIINDRML